MDRFTPQDGPWAAADARKYLQLSTYLIIGQNTLHRPLGNA